MSKNSQSKPSNPPNNDDKSPAGVLIAKYGLVGTIVGAVVSVIGVSVAAYFSYLGIKTAIELPLNATQTAAALRTPIQAYMQTPSIGVNPSKTISPSNTETPIPVSPIASPTTFASPTFPTVVPTISSMVITDTFDEKHLNPNLWQPPTNPSIIFPENGSLVFQVTPEQAVNSVDAELSLAPQAYPIRDISLSITMISYAREGEGGVSVMAYMADGPDHYVSLTHDDVNAAIELGICKEKQCTGQYDEYQHPESTHVKENVPTNVHITWDGNAVAMYVDGIKRAAVAAKNIPIESFKFSLFATPGGAFEAVVDNLSITFANQ